MARAAQTKTAVLGVLSVEAATGYEIRRLITEVLGHFWHESFGQLYPCLSELEADGLIASSPGPRTGSSVFAITDAGITELRTLLRATPVPQPPRNGVLLRTFFGDVLDDADLESLLDHTESEARSRLATFGAIRNALQGQERYERHLPYWQATIRAGELAAQASVQWVSETRALLLAPATLPPS